jgi:hypothetical protein
LSSFQPYLPTAFIVWNSTVDGKLVIRSFEQRKAAPYRTGIMTSNEKISFKDISNREITRLSEQLEEHLKSEENQRKHDEITYLKLAFKAHL